MDTEQALTIAANWLSAKNKCLSPVQKAIFQQAWEGKKLMEIQVDGYSDGHIQRILAPQLWNLLREVTGEKIGIKNLKLVFEELQHRQLPKVGDENKNVEIGEKIKARITSRQDWDAAPAIDIFYGRQEEIAKLQQWMIIERCKLITIFGFRGIGTTSLAVEVAKKSQSQFEFVIWRSLRFAPPLTELLADLMGVLYGKEIENFLSVSSAISQLISALEKSRCLVVLDAWQEVFSSGETAGIYREGYQEYGEFLKRVAQSNHKSCVVLTSWEKPKEIAVFERASSGVHSLQIQGLGQAATDIFRDKNLKEQERWEELIKVYRGNPFALNVVAVMIQEVFAGNVSEFLQKNTLFLGDIENLLYEQFKRLSILEKEIMVFLEKAKQPVSFTELHEQMPEQISGSKLIEFLQSLKWRCLIESFSGENETFYSLQPMVMRYIKNQSFC